MDATDIGEIGTFITRQAGIAGQIRKYWQSTREYPRPERVRGRFNAIAAALFADKSKAILASAIKYGVPVYRDGP